MLIVAAWTQDDLAALEKAIALGAEEVQYADKKVKYRSLAEMMAVRDRIRESLGQTNASGKRTYLKTSRGL